MNSRDNEVQGITPSRNTPELLFQKLLILFYVPAIAWFGHEAQLLKYERAYLVVLALAFLIFSVKGSVRIRIPLPFWILMAWMVWAGIGSILSDQPDQAIVRLAAVVLRAAVALVIINLVLRTDGYSWLLWSFILASLGSGLFALAYPGAFGDLARMASTLRNPNIFGTLLVITMGCVAYLGLTVKSRVVQIFLLGLAVFFTYLILETGSRKAMIGVFFVIGVIGVFRFLEILKQSAAKALVFAGVCVAVSLLLFSVILASPHGDRLVRVYDAYVLGDESREGRSESGRLFMYQRGFEIAMANPFLGIGLDNFRELQSDQMGRRFGTYSHSNYIELLVSTGIMGVSLYYMAWIVIILRIVLSMRLTENRTAPLALALVVTFLAFDLAVVSYYSKIMWAGAALILASMVLSGRRLRRSRLDGFRLNNRFQVEAPTVVEITTKKRA